MNSYKLYQIFLLTFFGTLGSILVGFIFFNTSIFIPTRTNFQFVIFGLIGSLFFSIMEYGNIKEQLYLILFIVILHLVIFTGKSLTVAYIIRDVLYLGSLFVSVKLYSLFLKNYKIKFYLRSFALVLFYGLINIIGSSIVFLINAKAGFPPIDFIYARARDAALIGFGIGLGIDFYLQNKNKILSLLKIKTA
jgi:hypothetical protein